MEELEKYFMLCEVSFNACQQRTMCFPHIINIVVQHVITKLSCTAAPKDEDDDNYEEDNIQSSDQSCPTSHDVAFAWDPIAHC